MTYAQRRPNPSDEQLDWLYNIAEESRAQTDLLRRIARHTGLIYGLTIVWLVLIGIFLLASLWDAVIR